VRKLNSIVSFGCCIPNLPQSAIAAVPVPFNAPQYIPPYEFNKIAITQGILSHW